MSLEKLQIRGFGANKKLDIEFSPAVTTIVGKNFQGKSWILRALKWVMQNQPSGDSFINWDSNEAKVRLSIDNKRVVRKRGKKSNLAGSYSFSGKQQPYVSFNRNEAPKEIAEFLNVSNINFQKQHSLPFWFDETAGQVSCELNSIIDLEIIDKTLRKIESEKHKTSTVINISKKSLRDLEQEKNELQYIIDLDNDLQHIECLQSEYVEIHGKCTTIDGLLKSVQNYVNIQENRLGLVSGAAKVISMAEKHQKIEKTVESLSELIEDAERLEIKSERCAKLPPIKKLEKLNSELQKISNQRLQIENLIEDTKEINDNLNELEIQISNNQNEMKRISKGRCVLCGKKLN